MLLLDLTAYLSYNYGVCLAELLPQFNGGEMAITGDVTMTISQPLIHLEEERMAISCFQTTEGELECYLLGLKPDALGYHKFSADDIYDESAIKAAFSEVISANAITTTEK